MVQVELNNMYVNIGENNGSEKIMKKKITLQVTRTQPHGDSSCSCWKNESFSNVRSSRWLLYGITSSIPVRSSGRTMRK
jgi:hypothetical protein